jgi:hypothetical protein
MAFVRNNNNGNNNNNRPRHNNYNNNRPRHNNSGHSNSGQNPNGPRRHVSRINQVFESNGPEGRVRGTAQQIVEKYTTMGRDAAVFGDRVLSMSYLQHAEHYQRLLNEITEENAVFEKERDAQRQLQQAQPEVSTTDAEAGFVGGEQPVSTEQPQQRAERPERAERPQRQERPERVEREDRPRPQQRERRPAHDVPDNELPSFLQVPIAAGKPEDGDKPARPAPVLRPRRIAPAPKADDTIAEEVANGPSDE